MVGGKGSAIKGKISKKSPWEGPMKKKKKSLRKTTLHRPETLKKVEKAMFHLWTSRNASVGDMAQIGGVHTT